jgi:hypothetical protein
MKIRSAVPTVEGGFHALKQNAAVMSHPTTPLKDAHIMEVSAHAVSDSR